MRKSIKELGSFLVGFSVTWSAVYGIVTGIGQSNIVIPLNSQVLLAFLTSLSVAGGLAAFYVERERERERQIIMAFKDLSSYTRACTEIHRQFSRVMIFARTPGLVLPTERDMTEERKAQFALINDRLSHGRGGLYELRYLFDHDGFKSVLKEYFDSKDSAKIKEVRETIVRLLSYPNLEIRFTEVGPLASATIGGESVTCLGFREAATRKVTEGVRIEAPELVKIIKAQYESLFASAKKLDAAFLDRLLSELVQPA